MTDRLDAVQRHLDDMRHLIDHDGEYLEPDERIPYDHCDGIFCVRCAIEEGLFLCRVDRKALKG